MSLLFESELKTKMAEYGQIKAQIDDLKLQMTKIREQVDEWMKLNKLQHHQTMDPTNKLWQIEYCTRTSKKPNWPVIKELISPDKHDELILESISDPYLSIREVKNFKKKKVKNGSQFAPPSENI